MPRRGRAAPLLVALAPVPALGALAAPWVRTGARARSAFGLVAALRSAVLAGHGPAQALFVVVALVPGLAAATWVLWAARYRRASAAAAALAGGLVTGASLAVRAVAHAHAAPSLPWATAAAVAAFALAALALVTDHRKAGT